MKYQEKEKAAFLIVAVSQMSKAERTKKDLVEKYCKYDSKKIRINESKKKTFYKKVPMEIFADETSSFVKGLERRKKFRLLHLLSSKVKVKKKTGNWFQRTMGLLNIDAHSGGKEVKGGMGKTQDPSENL